MSRGVIQVRVPASARARAKYYKRPAFADCPPVDNWRPEWETLTPIAPVLAHRTPSTAACIYRERASQWITSTDTLICRGGHEEYWATACYSGDLGADCLMPAPRSIYRYERRLHSDGSEHTSVSIHLCVCSKEARSCPEEFQCIAFEFGVGEYKFFAFDFCRYLPFYCPCPIFRAALLPLKLKIRASQILLSSGLI